MGNTNIICFTLWIIFGKFCATFSFDLETATGAEFGEFADEGTHARFANAINVDMQKHIRNRSGPCVYKETTRIVWRKGRTELIFPFLFYNIRSLKC